MRHALVLFTLALLPGCGAVHRIPGAGPSLAERWCSTYAQGYSLVAPFLDGLSAVPAAAGPLATVHLFHASISSMCGRASAASGEMDERMTEVAGAVARLLEIQQMRSTQLITTERLMAMSGRGSKDFAPAAEVVDFRQTISALKDVQAEAARSVAR